MNEPETVIEDARERLRRRLSEAEASGQLQGPGGRLPDRAAVAVRRGGKRPSEIIDEERR